MVQSMLWLNKNIDGRAVSCLKWCLAAPYNQKPFLKRLLVAPPAKNRF
jgi:hypothetical protein